MNLQEELQKAEYCHKLEMRRMWFEKGLLAAMVGVVALCGTLYLERFRTELASRRFLLENRFKASTELRGAYDRVLKSMVTVVSQPSDTPWLEVEKTKVLDEYKMSLSALLETENRWGGLFAPEFDRRVQAHASVHEAIANSRVTLANSDYEFCRVLGDDFDLATRIAMWSDTPVARGGEFLVVPDLPPTARENLAAAYYKEIHDHWLHSRGTAGARD